MPQTLIEIDNFIAGDFVPCRRTIESFRPDTGEVNARIPDSGSLEVEAAVAAAKRAFPGWSATPIEERANYLLRVALLVEERLSEFAVAESRDQGKPEWLTREVDIPRVVHNFRHFAHTAPHLMERSKLITGKNTHCYTTRSPLGVAGLISPWNLPLYLLTFKIAPALITGNTFVAKPSEMSSVSAFMLCKVFKEVGLPPGVANVVFGLGPQVGAPLVAHPDVPLISFTGSTATGKNIAVAAAPLFKKLSLEMGGKNAAIVFPDADLEKATLTLIKSSFINQGQVCLCTSKIFVHKDVLDEFLEAFVQKTRNLKVGDPSDPDSYLGALNSAPHFNKVGSYVGLAKEEGGTVLCGETVDKLFLKPQNAKGYFMLPTVITGLPDTARCMQEEIFGPVVCVTSFDTEEEVIERANNTPYGLCASVWTSNIGIAHRMAHKLKVGTVWTNCWMIRDLDIPFGGVKASGVGCEGTQESFNFYTQVKAICTSID